jgi:ABC-type branched-subunit amino acid transport system ATPase component
MSLQVRSLSASYGQAQVLWNVDFDVADGEVIGILGRNGAGKTTLLRALCGLHPKLQGGIGLDGRNVVGMPANEIAILGVSVLREAGRCASSLTVVQHLGLGQRLAKLRGKSAVSISEIWRWFPLLEPLQHRKAGLLSGGQRQALALAVALVARPRWILLDEPSAGLAPPVARDLFATIGQLASTGVTTLIVEQHAAWLEKIANRAYALEVGRIVRQGPISDFLGASRAAELQ